MGLFLDYVNASELELLEKIYATLRILEKFLKPLDSSRILDKVVDEI